MSIPSPTSAALTEQQRRAVVTRAVSVVLSSGAGCGKTHVLTERYLAHLRDDGAEVAEVVAITFTDRAARQMRARIRRAVVEHLRAATGAAADTWARHLRGLETAPISTIHAFCAALLRQHAVEAGLDPRFDVLEEVLATNLESEALATCLQRLLTAQTEAGEDLRQLVLLYGWRPVVEAVGNLLRAGDPGPWEQWLALQPEDVSRAWLHYARAELLPRYVAHIFAARPALARCLSLLHCYPPLPGPMADNVRRLFDRLPRLAEAPDLEAAVGELVEAAKVGKVGSKAWPDKAVYEPIKKALEAFREELRKQQLERFAAAPEALAEAVAVGRRFLRVAGEAARAYEARKRLHGVVDFQDLLLHARDLVRDHAEVRARLRERYRFLLIDELQDTDPVQMELIEHLCGGGLTAGKLFAVGDYKQSIYRFRGAEVSLFQALRERVAHEGRQGLTVNFRSQPAVLDFVNALLGHRLPDYEPLRAHHDQVNPGPCVEFLWAPAPAKYTAAEGRAIEAEWIARRIAGMIGREALVVDRDAGTVLHPVRAGDVVLLFRAMSNVHLYEAALRRHGLNYYLVGGRAFFAQQEIYDLLNLQRALENPQDAVSLAGTLRSPFCCVSDEALFVLGRHRDGLWAGLLDESGDGRLPPDQRERVGRARRHLQRWRGLKDRLPIARLLGAVFADSGYDAATQLEFLADRKLANLWKLLDLARTFDRSGLFGLAEFIDRLGDLVRTQPREEQAATQPENADVVRLMTIHQAKGLEFPVVIVPDVAAKGGDSAQPVAAWDTRLGCVVRPPADEEPASFADFAWRLRQARGAMEDWAEDLRTLYVACTRARDYLLLAAALPEDFQPGNAWMLTLAERFDLETGQCLAPEVPEGERPRIHVHDRLHPPPAPPPPAPENAVSAVPPSLTPPSQERSPPPAVVRLVTIAQLETALQTKETLFAGMIGNEACGPALAQGPAERMIRAVLRTWDFREPDGWRPLLRQHVLAETADAVAREAEEMLECFAASALRRQLAEAVVCQREVEFLLNLSGPGAPLPSLGGVIDCLWQDAAGQWHLVFYTTAAVSVAGRARHWRGREWSLVLAAEALRRQTGSGPASVTLHFLRDGGRVRRAGGRLPVHAVLPEVTDALAALAHTVPSA